MWLRSSQAWMRSSQAWMRSSQEWIRSSQVWMRSSQVLMRSNQVVWASGCQCQQSWVRSQHLRHSGIWGRQMKQCWIAYIKRKNPKYPPLSFILNFFVSNIVISSRTTIGKGATLLPWPSSPFPSHCCGSLPLLSYLLLITTFASVILVGRQFFCELLIGLALRLPYLLLITTFVSILLIGRKFFLWASHWFGHPTSC